MLGLDACELGAQLLELLRLALCARGERPGWGQGGHVGGGLWAGALSPGQTGFSPSETLGALVGTLQRGTPAALWRGWGAYPRLDSHGARGQEGAGLLVKPGPQGAPLPAGTCP